MDKNPMAVISIRTRRRSYKYRIYPTKAQIKTFENCLELSRQLYNMALDHRRHAWEEYSIPVTYREQSAKLPKLKKDRPEYAEINAQVLQQNLVRLDKAFKSFFWRVKAGEKPGYPRFKAEGWYSSLIYPQHENGFHLVSKKHLFLSGVGEVRIKFHRDVLGKIKTCTIKRTASGQWYASFSCDEVPVMEDWPEATGEVGIDPGLTSFATISDGKNETKIDNPRWFRKTEKKIAEAQRELQAKKNGSKNRAKAKANLAKLHEKVSRQRDDFQWKLAREIVRKNRLITIEDTDVKEMVEKSSRGISKSVNDAAWSGFAWKVSCKASDAGRTFLKSPAPWSSSSCSGCGHRLPEKLPLSERVFCCPKCGFKLDRDANAARNHLRAGQALWRSTGQEAAGL